MIFHRLTALCLVLALAVFAPGPAGAQTQPNPAAPTSAEGTGPIDYAAWDADARRAENLIDAGTASTAFLTNLRATLVGWRARFLEAQNTNAARIDTIEAQITALGPAPVDGAAEPAAIAQRRAELSDQLAQAQVPRVTATEAFNRANGLVAEIDDILAARQARALLERDPAPINPLNWTQTLVALADVAFVLEDEIRSQVLRLDRAGQSVWDRLPFAVVVALVGLGLLSRSRYFVGRWTDRMQRHSDLSRGRIALAFLVSLLQVLLPIIGLVLLGVAVAAVDILGTAGRALMSAIIAALVTVFAALWLAGRLFPVNPDLAGGLAAPVDLRPALRRSVVTIGLFLGLGGLAETLSTLDAVPLVARGVFVLPIYLGLAWGFFRLAQLLRRARRAQVRWRARRWQRTARTPVLPRAPSRWWARSCALWRFLGRSLRRPAI